MIVSSILGIVPWYVWGGAIALLVLITLLNLWPVVFGVGKVARALWTGLPTDAKIAVAAIAGLTVLVVLHFWVVRERVNVAILEERGRGAARLAAGLENQRQLYQSQIQAARDAGQAKLDALGVEFRKEQLARAADHAAAEKRHQAAIASLKEGFANYVTPLQLSRCSDVPRGYLVRRANAASYANGGAESAGPPASAASFDEPSGVSLAALDATDVEAAGAYRSCRNLVAEWEDWGARVERLYAGVQQAIQPSKGVTQ